MESELMLLQIEHPKYGWLTVERVHPSQIPYAFETCDLYQRYNNVRTRIISQVLLNPWDTTTLKEVLHLDGTTTPTQV